MSVEVLPGADPLGRVVGWLLAHPAVTAALGGPDRVSADNEGPYPHLQVTDVGGNYRAAQWLVATDIQVEALADLDGGTDRATLKRLMLLACAAVAELPEHPAPLGGPVISQVESQGARGWVPLASGQGRYLTILRVWSHP
uniref:hypothetical protein n=1 Tax=Nonomuraea sp. CA-251285 TaxID=3240002 RepID=UPI003F49A5E7